MNTKEAHASAKAERNRIRKLKNLGPARDPLYLAWIRTQPCACCGRAAPSEAAHVGDDKAARLKGSDYDAIPLCWQCHREGRAAAHKLTGDFGRAFFRHHRIDRDGLIQRLRRMYAAATGRPVP